jgi:hypothetical protein
MFVELSSLDTTDRRTRIRGDLAGVALDGYVLSLVTAVALATNLVPMRAVTFTLALVALGSFNPMTKSDLNWALRDALNARHLSAAWGRPRAVLAAAVRGDSGTKAFARLAIACYFAFVIVTLFFIAQVFADVVANGIPPISPWSVASFLAAAACVVGATIAVKRYGKTDRTDL